MSAEAESPRALAFDAGFKALCVEHGIQAAYISVGGLRHDGAMHLVAGGDPSLGVILDATIDRALADVIVVEPEAEVGMSHRDHPAVVAVPCKTCEGKGQTFGGSGLTATTWTCPKCKGTGLL